MEEEERMRINSTDSTSAHPEVENIILNYSTVAVNRRPGENLKKSNLIFQNSNLFLNKDLKMKTIDSKRFFIIKKGNKEKNAFTNKITSILQYV